MSMFSPLPHVRNSLCVLKRAENRRKDFVGVTAADLDVIGIFLRADKHSSAVRFPLSTYVRYLAGLEPSASCLFCDGDDKDVCHMFYGRVRAGTTCLLPVMPLPLRLRPLRPCTLCSLASSRLAHST